MRNSDRDQSFFDNSFLLRENEKWRSQNRMPPKPKFVPNRKNLPPVPGSPSMNDEESLKSSDTSTEDLKRCQNENPNSEAELEVVSTRRTETSQSTTRTSESPFGTGTKSSTNDTTTSSSSSGNFPGKSQFRSQISDRISRMSSRSSNSRMSKESNTTKPFVRTPSVSSVSKESGYHTSTQKTSLSSESPDPVLTVQSETAIQMTGRKTPSVSQSGSDNNLGEVLEEFQPLPTVFYDTSKSTGKDVNIGATTSRQVAIGDLVTTADPNQEDSEDFVFTSTSEQNTSERRRIRQQTTTNTPRKTRGTPSASQSMSQSVVASNISSGVTGGSQIVPLPQTSGNRSHRGAGSSITSRRLSNDTQSTLDSLRSPTVASQRRSDMSGVAKEEQNQLEESLLLDLSTLGSSPRNHQGTVVTVDINSNLVSSKSGQMQLNPADPSGQSLASSEEGAGLGNLIRIHVSGTDKRGHQQDMRSVNPSEWGKTSVNVTSLPTARTAGTTTSGEISTYSGNSPSFSVNNYFSPPGGEREGLGNDGGESALGNRTRTTTLAQTRSFNSRDFRESPADTRPESLATTDMTGTIGSLMTHTVISGKELASVKDLSEQSSKLFMVLSGPAN
ncbi:uncharacterized protein LOC142347919 [Convolutriloba macropyga]|uniref:uncharacterized protein LOC142347919 n=1 Tax=Convolutriloba macropyga TaxID=536237 RepID=UPI003F51B4CC